MVTKFELPSTASQVGKFLRVASDGTYEWFNIGGAGLGYTLIEEDGSSVTQRTTLNFIDSFFEVSDNPGNLSTDISLNVATIANDSDFVDALIANTYFTTELATSTDFIDELVSNNYFTTILANESNFYTELVDNSAFTTYLAGDTNFTTVLAGDTNFITELENNPTFVTAITTIVTTGGGVLFQTEGTDNGDQAKLNLIAGTNMVITDDGMGNITFDATGGGGSGEVVRKTFTQTAHGFLDSQVLRSSGTDGEYALAQADTPANADVIGIITTVVNANSFVVTVEGFDIIPSLPIGSVAGDNLYLDESTPGELSLVQPTTAGTVSQPLGRVINAATGLCYIHNWRGQEQQSTPSGGSTAIFKNGITTKDASDASGVQLIPHGLGFVPDLVKIVALMNSGGAGPGDVNSFIANTVYDGTTQSSVSIYGVAGGIYATTAPTFTLNVDVSPGAGTQTGVVTADATNIIITWTKTGTPLGIYKIVWEAQTDGGAGITTSKTIFGTRVHNAVSGTVLYPHGLAGVPSIIVVTGGTVVTGTDLRGSSNGVYDASGNNCLSYDTAAITLTPHPGEFIHFEDINGAPHNMQVGVVTAVDATNVEITWTLSGTGGSAGTSNFMMRCQL